MSERRPMSDLKSTGLLWLINRSVFHPRGFAFAMTPDGSEWMLLGDGSEPWTFVDEQAEFAAVTKLFREAGKS